MSDQPAQNAAPEAAQAPAAQAAAPAQGAPEPQAKGNAGDQNADPPGAEHLGDPGKRALDAMKEERRLAREEAARWKSEFEALKAQVEGKQAEYEAAQERAKVEAEALAKANERILKAELRAEAAGKLADPSDALRFLDLSEFEVGPDGDVDKKAIAEAIDDLIKTKPYLAAQGKRFEGSADGGARNDARPAQLTQEMLKGMSPEAIREALRNGQLVDLLGKK